jgi:DNA (cytosine-5)-methyltransferase 1
VYANRENNVPRPADLEPAHAVLTGSSQAVVMRNNEARGDAGQMCTPTHEPVRTLTSRGHQSLVMANTENGVPRPAGREPSQTLRTEGGLAIVVPYTRTGEPLWAAERPMPTLTTRDRAAGLYMDDEVDDCLFRMFALHEIAGAMAMNEHVDGGEYVVTGNKRERMAQYGNAVTPPAARELVARIIEALS